MATETSKIMNHQNNYSKADSANILEQFNLKNIIDHSYDPIFVTDKFGDVILVNIATGRLLGIEPESLVGQNVKELVLKGIYTWSPTLKAIETGSVVTGLLKTKYGNKLMCTSTTMMDEKGEIIMVITNAREKELVDKYLISERKEKLNPNSHNNVEYLKEVEIENKHVIAESKQMRQIISITKNIAKTDSTVLLVGESGTGKEVMSRFIHRNSLRAKEPFITVNCAAIPSELLESEFFGYVRGAFTGANSQGKPGLFEMADHGTLFLDEIGELPLAMQSKLLRVLETGEIQRLGSTSVYRTNVRLIAATNRDLKTMVNDKLFRSDLYYRLNVIPINLPPLRERPEDIKVLAQKFLDDLNKRYSLNKSFTTQAIEGFLNYSWPGNIRELRNVVERLVITSTGNALNLKLDILENNPNNKNVEIPSLISMYKGTLKSVLKTVEEGYIKQVLEECNGRVGEAASKLGIHRTILYRKTNNKTKNNIN